MSNQQDMINAVLRSDARAFFERSFLELQPAASYQHNWHIDLLIYLFSLCMEGKVTRLLITLPPRYMKSMLFSVVLPAFWMGRDPSLQVVTSSYGHQLSSTLSLMSRKLIMTDWYRRAFPHFQIDTSKDTSGFFKTSKGGHRLTTSVGGAVTGIGADLIIYDDPLKASGAPSENELEIAWDHLKSTLMSRLNSKSKGVVIVIQQRLHERDVAGRLLEEDGWHVCDIPAIAEDDRNIQIGPENFYFRAKGEALHPERDSVDQLERLQVEMGSKAFSAQYQQRPIPAGGGILEWRWFKTYESLPNNGEGGFIVQSWDTAMGTNPASGSYSVCTTWFCFDDRYYLIDVWRYRRSSAELPRLIHEHAIKFNADHVLIERHNGTETLIHNIHNHTRLHWDGIKPTVSKAVRMEGETPKIEDGRVFLPRDAHWLEAFRAEVMAFPEGKYDDQIDSLSQFLLWARCASPDNPRGKFGRGIPGGPVGPQPQPVGNVGPSSRFIGLGGPRRNISLRGIDLSNLRWS